MIAWDKTAAQGIGFPDDIWGHGDREGKLFRMTYATTTENQTRRERRTDLSIDGQDLAREQVVGKEQDHARRDSVKETSALSAGKLIVSDITGVVVTGTALIVSTLVVPIASPLSIATIVTLGLRFMLSLYRCATVPHEQCTLRISYRQVVQEEVTFTLAFCAATYLLSLSLSRQFVLSFAALNLLFQSGVFWLGRKLLSKELIANAFSHKNRAIIVGTGERAKQVATALLEHPELDTAPIGFLDDSQRGLWRFQDIPLLGKTDDLKKMILERQIDAVFVATESGDQRTTVQVLSVAREMGVTAHLVPMFSGAVSPTIETARLNGFPTLVYRATNYRRLSMLFKRGVDLIGGGILLLLSAPVMISAAIAVKLNCEGPALFKQIRSGRNGRRFMLYKFRTMTLDAEHKKKQLLDRNEMSGPVFKIADDPRVTSVGKFLRKYSIDELPQLFNVLAGDMSLVGPRPPLPSEVLGYEPWQRRKLSVRPGLTCLWQVNGRNSIDFEDWMKLDLQYIDTWSLTLDMKILARTVPTVLKGSGV